jgi:hypothetical protein
MSTRVLGACALISGADSSALALVAKSRVSGWLHEPSMSTRVVEPFISLPLGLFSYTDRFFLQMGDFVTSPGLWRERVVTIEYAKMGSV